MTTSEHHLYASQAALRESAGVMLWRVLWKFRPLAFTLAMGGMFLLLISFSLVIARQSEPASPWITFVSTREGVDELYRMRLDGSHVRQMTYLAQNDFFPVVSPDGQWVAYAASRRLPPRIYASHLDGSDFRQLSPGNIFAVQPSWSPDGKWITYTSNEPGRYEIYRVNIDSGERIRLTNRPNSDWNPTWSPDGQWIAFESETGGNRDIYLVRADNVVEDAAVVSAPGFQEELDEEGAVIEEEALTEAAALTYAAPTRLTTAEGDDWQAAWSPDGQWIAFISERDGTPELYRMRPDGTAVQRITYNDITELRPDWSPDDAWITFESTHQGNRDIYRVSVAGGDAARLTTNHEIDRNPQWTAIVDFPWRGLVPILGGLALAVTGFVWVRSGMV